jgi:hypothetical protein
MPGVADSLVRDMVKNEEETRLAKTGESRKSSEALQMLGSSRTTITAEEDAGLMTR